MAFAIYEIIEQVLQQLLVQLFLLASDLELLWLLLFMQSWIKAVVKREVGTRCCF